MRISACASALSRRQLPQYIPPAPAARIAMFTPAFYAPDAPQLQGGFPAPCASSERQCGSEEATLDWLLLVHAKYPDHGPLRALTLVPTLDVVVLPGGRLYSAYTTLQSPAENTACSERSAYYTFAV